MDVLTAYLGLLLLFIGYVLPVTVTVTVTVPVTLNICKRCTADCGAAQQTVINNCEQCAFRLVTLVGGGDTCMDPYAGGYSGRWGGCNTGDTHCLKVKTVTYLYDSGSMIGDPRETVTVTRTCIKKPGAKDGCRKWATDSGFMIWCICSNADDCNGGHQLAPNVVMAMALTLAVILRNIL